ncbi:unnamed protein product, partial [Musa textilis]
WETLERHRGGRTDSRRGAANLPFSTPPRGTGTSPRSSRSATLIPSPSILEIAIPGHRILSPLFSFPQSSFFVVVIMWWTLLLVQNLSSKQLIAPPRLCLQATLMTLHNKLMLGLSWLDSSDA